MTHVPSRPRCQGVAEDEAIAAIAHDVREGPFVRRCLALAAWVGEQGRELTATGVLHLADARAAYQELGLAETTPSASTRDRPDQPSLFASEEEAALVQESPLVALLPQAGDGSAETIPFVTAQADGTWSRRQLTKAWWRSVWNPQGRHSDNPTRGRSDRTFRAALEMLADLGVWRVSGDDMTPTSWGVELLSVLDPREEDIEEDIVEVAVELPPRP